MESLTLNSNKQAFTEQQNIVNSSSKYNDGRDLEGHFEKIFGGNDLGQAAFCYNNLCNFEFGMEIQQNIRSILQINNTHWGDDSIKVNPKTRPRRLIRDTIKYVNHMLRDGNIDFYKINRLITFKKVFELAVDLVINKQWQEGWDELARYEFMLQKTYAIIYARNTNACKTFWKNLIFESLSLQMSKLKI
ncbi:hypothetical protein ACQ4LE_001789 [Meloidogyne hapla]|uniref:Uncharacterized protein n=1 Tax=Meloidogyne hapla TaxID=6305 RepID=A0A1I8BW75_MELHA